MFLHPWAIAMGVAAAGLPVLVHWLTRPRPVQLPFSTMRFVHEALQQRRARNRLRDYLILALRTLAVLLIAAAVAKPMLDGYATAAADDSADTIRVVILDVSHSMRAVNRGVQTFERARPVALKYLAHRPSLRVNLILAGATPRAIFERPSTNFAILRDELVKANTLPQRLQVQPALNLAAEMFDAPAGVRRELLIVSDFQRTNWASADFSALPEGTDIRLESVASETTPPNLAIQRVAYRGRPEKGRELELEVDVGNFSDVNRSVQVAVTLGTVSCQLKGSCPPQGKTTLTGNMILTEPGWQAGTAKLIDVEDSLADDNSRHFAVEVLPSPKYALITRQTERDRPSSSYFLERALSPQVTDRAPRMIRLAPAKADRETLAPAELILMDHPGRLSGEKIDLLASLLRRGRRILYVASENADAANLKLLTETAGCGLQMPVEFSPPAAGVVRKNLFLAETRGDQPPFGVFGDSVRAVMSPQRFGGGLATRRLTTGLDEDILAKLNDQSAFLVITSSGSCELAVLNADLGASTLPKTAAFVPLLGDLVEHLLGHSRVQSEFLSGEPMAVYLPFDAGTAEGLTVSGIGPGLEPMGEFASEGSSVLWRAASAGKPGVYAVKRGDQTVSMASTASSPDEADLRPLAEDVLSKRLAGGRRVRFHTATEISEERDDRLWIWAAVACVSCMLGEVLSLRLLRT